MLQRKLTLVPGVFALALVATSWVILTGAARASEKCLTAPNAPAPRDQHWYYRTDRATSQQCWYLASRNPTVRKRTTQEAKLPGSELLLPRQAPSSTPSPNETALNGTSDASEAETKVPVAESVISWSEPAKAPDIPPSFERGTSPSTDVITPTPARGPAHQLHAATTVQAAVKVDWPSPAIVITLALLALSGPMYHAVRWLRRRKAHDRWNAEWSYRSALNEAYTRNETGLTAESREQITETLQQLLNEMRTKLYGTSDTVRPIPEQELDQNRESAANHTPTIRLSVSSH